MRLGRRRYVSFRRGQNSKDHGSSALRLSNWSSGTRSKANMRTRRRAGSKADLDSYIDSNLLMVHGKGCRSDRAAPGRWLLREQEVQVSASRGRWPSRTAACSASSAWKGSERTRHANPVGARDWPRPRGDGASAQNQAILFRERVERATGIEPVTSSLGSWHSTAELRPRAAKSRVAATVCQMPAFEHLAIGISRELL